MTNEDLKEAIDRGFERMDQRFDALNGRVRTSENKIAVLEDRSDREKATASKWGGVTGSIGGLIGGFLAGLMGSK